jgi:hypothetical protein
VVKHVSNPLGRDGITNDKKTVEPSRGYFNPDGSTSQATKARFGRDKLVAGAASVASAATFVAGIAATTQHDHAQNNGDDAKNLAHFWIPSGYASYLFERWFT